MRVNPPYRFGDYLVVTDGTGRVEHASNTRLQYDGLLKEKSDFDYRHPQEFKRSVEDIQSVSIPRPPGPVVEKFVNSLDESLGR